MSRLTGTATSDNTCFPFSKNTQFVTIENCQKPFTYVSLAIQTEDKRDKFLLKSRF